MDFTCLFLYYSKYSVLSQAKLSCIAQILWYNTLKALKGAAMDRSNIDKIAQTADDRVLLAKVWDKINAGMR
ncbi:MAG: hypothetical protein J6Q54_05195, partial [Oscillospiraceae bacterium]|nr:hypothetical protein [Oscillospiraceae bacterium]